MASQALLDFVEELKEERAELVPQLEGLRDFSRLNIKEETAPVINKAIEDFDRRINLIDAALTSCANLSTDGYPDMPIREVVEGIYVDLADNVATINAAFTKFKPKEEAASASITSDDPESKS